MTLHEERRLDDKELIEFILKTLEAQINQWCDNDPIEAEYVAQGFIQDFNDNLKIHLEKYFDVHLGNQASLEEHRRAFFESSQGRL